MTTATPTKINKRAENIKATTSTLCGVRSGVGMISKKITYLISYPITYQKSYLL